MNMSMAPGVSAVIVCESEVVISASFELRGLSFRTVPRLKFCECNFLLGRIVISSNAVHAVLIAFRQGGV